MTAKGDEAFPYIPTIRRTGTERFTLDTETLQVDLLSFWQWSASNLIGNTMRGCLAEYIVALALGLTSGVRNDWEAYDLKFNEWRIEVKASGYLQTWSQKRLSRPLFSIRPARKWNPITNEMGIEMRRESDLYVFALHHHKEKPTLDPLDLTQWTFYVLPTARLEDSPQLHHAKSISFSSLLTLHPLEVAFSNLKRSIIELTEGMRPADSRSIPILAGDVELGAQARATGNPTLSEGAK
jgi:hypothetical protein